MPCAWGSWGHDSPGALRKPAFSVCTGRMMRLTLALFREHVKGAPWSGLAGAQECVCTSGCVDSEAGSALAAAWRSCTAVGGGLEGPWEILRVWVFVYLVISYLFGAEWESHFISAKSTKFSGSWILPLVHLADKP